MNEPRGLETPVTVRRATHGFVRRYGSEMMSCSDGGPGFGHLSTTVDKQHDQRRCPRVVLGADVSLRGATTARPECGHLVNLSLDGAFVLTPSLYPVGSVLKLKLCLPGAREVSSSVRVRSRLAGRGNGVAFLSLAPEQRSSIEAVIWQQSQGSRSTAARSLYSY